MSMGSMLQTIEPQTLGTKQVMRGCRYISLGNRTRIVGYGWMRGTGIVGSNEKKRKESMVEGNMERDS